MADTPEHEFHVVDHEIVIDFDVPLSHHGDDEVLTDLLTHHAMEIIRDRRNRGQPLEGIPVARVRARRDGSPVEVAAVELEAHEIPEIDLPDLVPRRATAGYDLLARLGEGEETDMLSLSSRRSGDSLAPLGDEIRLTVGLGAGLRSLGIDPESMTMAEFAPGLLRLAGYRLSERDDGSYLALGEGSSTYVEVVEHQPGDYPELSESRVSSFLFAYAGARADHGLLMTDKYGPYGIYAKERANPHCHFITRERLQSFVDRIAIG